MHQVSLEPTVIDIVLLGLTMEDSLFPLDYDLFCTAPTMGTGSENTDTLGGYTPDANGGLVTLQYPEMFESQALAESLSSLDTVC